MRKDRFKPQAQNAASKRRRSFPSKYVIAAITLFIFIGLIVWGIHDPGQSVLLFVLGILAILVNALQWLFPVPVEISEDSSPPAPSLSSPPSPSLPEAQPRQRHSTPVFFCNEPLPNIQEFYGRRRESASIVGRVRRGASTSIIGPRRIGKTWCLQYIQFLLADEADQRFLIGYLDVSAPGCRTVNQFVNLALEALGANDTAVRGLEKLESFVKAQKQKGRIPVLLIDEFEGFANAPKQFTLDFFTGLRSIASAGLVIVTVSRSPLLKIVSKIAGPHTSTSPFFNIFVQVTLKPFAKFEAEDFVAKKSEQANFDPQARQALLKYGQIEQEQWPPLRLQLTGNLLQEDQRAAQHDPYLYRPNTPSYWTNFQERLQEIQGEVQ